jgi:hypothetical protein
MNPLCPFLVYWVRLPPDEEGTVMNLLVKATATALGSATLIFGGVGTAHAAGNPAGTGQPSQTCGDPTALMTPGSSVSAPGSAFNPDGHAGTVYAGEQPQNSTNPKSVSQYDVACFQVSQHG